MIWDPNEEGVIGNSWINFNYKWTYFKDYRSGYLKENTIFSSTTLVTLNVWQFNPTNQFFNTCSILTLSTWANADSTG